MKGNKKINQEEKINYKKIEKIFSLIEKGNRFIYDTTHENEKFKEVILIIGNSGSGKSTLVTYINDPNKLEASIIDNNIVIDLKKETDEKTLNKSTISLPKIGHSKDSETTIPNKCYDSVNKRIYWDCPGFGDTKGPKYDIPNAFFIKKIFGSYTEIKILLVVEYHDLISKVDKIKKTMDNLGDLFGEDIENIKQNLGLIISKVPEINKAKKKIGKKEIIIEIEKILKAEFFKQDSSGKKILEYFIKNENNFTLFKEPRQEGGLNSEDNNDLLGNNREIIDLIENIKPIASPEVVPPISSDSKLYIKGLHIEIIQSIRKDFEDCFNGIENCFNSKKNRHLSSLIYDKNKDLLKQKLEQATKLDAISTDKRSKNISEIEPITVTNITEKIIELDLEQVKKFNSLFGLISEIIGKLSDVNTVKSIGELIENIDLVIKDIKTKIDSVDNDLNEGLIHKIKEKGSYLEFCKNIDNELAPSEVNALFHWKSYATSCSEGIKQQSDTISGQILGEFNSIGLYLDKLVISIENHFFEMLSQEKSYDLFDKCNEYISTIKQINNGLNYLSIEEFVNSLENELIKKFEVDINLEVIRFIFGTLCNNNLVEKGKTFKDYHYGFIKRNMHSIQSYFEDRWHDELNLFIDKCFTDFSNIIKDYHFTKILSLLNENNQISIANLPKTTTNFLLKLNSELKEIKKFKDDDTKLNNVLSSIEKNIYKAFERSEVNNAKQTLSELVKFKKFGINIGSYLLKKLLPITEILSNNIVIEFKQQTENKIDEFISKIKKSCSRLNDSKIKKDIDIDRVLTNIQGQSLNKAICSLGMDDDLHLLRLSSAMRLIDELKQDALKILKLLNVIERNSEHHYNDLQDKWIEKISILRIELQQENLHQNFIAGLKILSNSEELSLADEEIKTSTIAPKITPETKIVKLKCLKRIEFDEDIKLNNIDLIIIAPEWKISKDKVIIDLSGSKGAKHNKQKADNGQGYKQDHSGSDAKHGLPGKSGKNGGSFYGICSEIELEELEKIEIITNGGDGGSGQDGGDGASGQNGQDANNLTYLIKEKKVEFSLSEHNYFGRNIYLRKDIHKGLQGFEGGKGGKLGIGGMSGNPGTVDIIEVSDQETKPLEKLIKVSANKGKPGDNGIPGIGGKGGKSGNDASIFHKIKKSNIFQKEFKEYLESKVIISTDSIRANDGATFKSLNDENQEQPLKINSEQFKAYVKAATSEWREISSLSKISALIKAKSSVQQNSASGDINYDEELELDTTLNGESVEYVFNADFTF